MSLCQLVGYGKIFSWIPTKLTAIRGKHAPSPPTYTPPIFRGQYFRHYKFQSFCIMNLIKFYKISAFLKATNNRHLSAYHWFGLFKNRCLAVGIRMAKNTQMSFMNKTRYPTLIMCALPTISLYITLIWVINDIWFKESAKVVTFIDNLW